MKYFLMPIDYNNYYSTNTQGGVGPWTYNTHGKGRLDFAYNCQGPIYSMTDGTVTGVGYYTGDDSKITHCDIKYYDEILEENVTIRYLHGEYPNMHNGDEVKCGDQIGTISNHDKGDLQHLHIDLQDTVSYLPDAMVGQLNFENKTFKYKNKIYPLKDSINLELIKTWNQQRGDSGMNVSIGYCWLIFAQEPQQLKPSPKPTEDIIKITNKYDTCPCNYTDDKIITAYYEKNLSENFCGAFPADWATLCSEDCWPIRCLLDFCQHEWGSFSNSFIRMGLVKMWRAGVIGNHTMWYWAQKGGSDNSNFQKFLENACTAAPDTNYGSWYENNGTHFISLGESAERLAEAQMAYYNFRYCDIYGSTTINNGSSKSTNALIDAINLLPTNNNKSSDQFNHAKFIYNWNMITDQDDGTYIGSDSNHAVLSRHENDDGMKAYHSEVLE